MQRLSLFKMDQNCGLWIQRWQLHAKGGQNVSRHRPGWISRPCRLVARLAENGVREQEEGDIVAGLFIEARKPNSLGRSVSREKQLRNREERFGSIRGDDTCDMQARVCRVDMPHRSAMQELAMTLVQGHCFCKLRSLRVACFEQIPLDPEMAEKR